MEKGGRGRKLRGFLNHDHGVDDGFGGEGSGENGEDGRRTRSGGCARADGEGGTGTGRWGGEGDETKY